MPAPRVGVLALQGDVREHVAMLERVGAAASLVRRAADLPALDGLVLPGGESSVIDKLSRAFGLQQPIRAAIANGLPVFGTCAGLILLADRVEGAAPGQQGFGGLDIAVKRNAFGSQIDSFEAELSVAGFDRPVGAAFIRAPLVTAVGPRARVLAALGDPAGADPADPGPAGGTSSAARVVAVAQGALMGTAFHPEVSGEPRFHELFLEIVRKFAAGRR